MAKSERMVSVSTLETALAKRFGGGTLHYDDLMAFLADVPSVDAVETAKALSDRKIRAFAYYGRCKAANIAEEKERILQSVLAGIRERATNEAVWGVKRIKGASGEDEIRIALQLSVRLWDKDDMN